MITGKHQKLIKSAYSFFNERKIDEVLALMQNSVRWPNGWEGGYVQGKEEVKEYWTRQWKELDPAIIPTEYPDTPSIIGKVNLISIIN